MKTLSLAITGLIVIIVIVQTVQINTLQNNQCKVWRVPQGNCEEWGR